ncbi:MAG: hypothetical protein KBA64_02010 [Armatimonadetes bacterium]|nr:hypothetical protein [Armatimonadota bacterium]
MTSSKPVAVIRYGRVRATIWPNDAEHGRRYTVTVSRLYKSGDEWKSSESFWRDDLPLVIKALDEAHTAILRGLDVPSDSEEDEVREGSNE